LLELFGSAANGRFNADTSDLDFLVDSETSLAATTLAAISVCCSDWKIYSVGKLTSLT
jgi:predicted nucleotidyltransferase